MVNPTADPLARLQWLASPGHPRCLAEHERDAIRWCLARMHRLQRERDAARDALSELHERVLARGQVVARVVEQLRAVAG